MLDTLQVGLDVVGLVPGVGEVADGLNAVIYYARGDKLNAALSVGAMIPFAGMAVTGGKLVTKGAKAFNGVVDGIKTVTNKGSIGELKEKATKKLDTVKDKFQTKVAEVKDQFRQLGTPQLEFAGVNMGRITDTGTVGKNKPTPNPKPSNSSKPPEKDSKPAEGTKGTGNLGISKITKDSPGQVIFGELDNLKRPTGMTATITKDMIGTGSKASQSITPPGFLGGGPGSPGHARGHLLGNQLGGTGKDARNLVTLYQNPVNSPVMRGFENSVRKAVEKGEIVRYQAIPTYQGNNLIPTGVTLKARGNSGFTMDVTIINRK